MCEIGRQVGEEFEVVTLGGPLAPPLQYPRGLAFSHANGQLFVADEAADCCWELTLGSSWLRRLLAARHRYLLARLLATKFGGLGLDDPARQVNCNIVFELTV
jgi:hypothetical protein